MRNTTIKCPPAIARGARSASTLAAHREALTKFYQPRPRCKLTIDWTRITNSFQGA